MNMSIVFATGPKVTTMTREAAVEAAKTSPQFPKNADDITVEELDGHWVAAIHVADSSKTLHLADNPFGGPADQTDDAPGPKSEGPDDTQDVKPDDGDSDDGGPPGDHSEPDGDEGPPKDGEHKEKGGESHKIDALFDAVQKILVALGIPDTEGGESPVPGEEPPAGPPEGSPPGAGAPPAPEEVHHEKSLKPGEVPPGQTPVGAPAFSHVNPIIARGGQHPWEGLIGVTATFEVEERVPDHYSAADVDAELQEVAYGTGFKVKQAQVYTDERTGHRIAKALISAY
jgi:hypothetical protein